MKVLFVASGNHGRISPVVKAQGDSLVKAGMEVVYFLVKGKGLKGYLRQVRPLHRFWKEGHFDVVHSHFSFSSYVASLAGVGPLVVSLMGSDLKSSRWNRVIIRFFSWLFRWREIIIKSKDMAKDLDIKNVHIIPNGVDLDLFRPMDKDGCRQRIGWEEGVRHVLFPANPNRPEKDFSLAKRAIALLDDDVRLHVFENVDFNDTVFHYNAADVVLLTSKWEGSPNVIKEALACSCTIVSVAVGDVRERLDCLDGCYVSENRTPEELAELLKKALLFEGKTNGREKLKKDGLSNEIVSAKLKRIYERMMRPDHVMDVPSLKVLCDGDIPKDVWEAFVLNHPQGSAFQAPQMYEFYARSVHGKPLAIALVDERDDEIQALMMSVVMTNGPSFLRYFTGRSIIIGGPLLKNGPSDAGLLSRLMAEYGKRLPGYVIYSEIRPICDMSDLSTDLIGFGFLREGHYNLRMDLGKEVDQLWEGMSKERRKNVNKAKNKGLTYREIVEDEEILMAVELIRQTYRRKRVPSSNVDMFPQWRHLLQGYLRFYAVFWEDRMIACQARLCFNELAYAWYTGSDEHFHSFKPNDFLTWNDICNAHDQGFKIYDIGGGGKPGVPYGVRDYKLKYGFEVFDFGRYLCVHKRILYKMGVLGMSLMKRKK